MLLKLDNKLILLLKQLMLLKKLQELLLRLLQRLRRKQMILQMELLMHKQERSRVLKMQPLLNSKQKKLLNLQQKLSVMLRMLHKVQVWFQLRLSKFMAKWWDRQSNLQYQHRLTGIHNHWEQTKIHRSPHNKPQCMRMVLVFIKMQALIKILLK